MKNMLLYLIPCLSVLLCSSAFANNYSAVQGDVLRLSAPEIFTTMQHNATLKVTAFGKTWPMYQHTGKNIAWIAIHLKTKPKTYTITWQDKHQTWTDTVNVQKGNFRISHISVKKSMSSFSPEHLKRLRADQKAIKTAYNTPANIKNDWPEMVWPVEGIISTPFAAQRYVNKQPRSPHSGIDIAAPSGTAVHAPLAGIVLLVEDMYLNGNLVAIGHGDGLTTVYAHLKKSLVKVGQPLQAGQIFAEVGSTGRSTGAHLHWGVHFAGAKINPRTMLSLPTQLLSQANNGNTK